MVISMAPDPCTADLVFLRDVTKFHAYFYHCNRL